MRPYRPSGISWEESLSEGYVDLFDLAVSAPELKSDKDKAIEQYWDIIDDAIASEYPEDALEKLKIETAQRLKISPNDVNL